MSNPLLLEKDELRDPQIYFNHAHWTQNNIYFVGHYLSCHLWDNTIVIEWFAGINCIILLLQI